MSEEVTEFDDTYRNSFDGEIAITIDTRTSKNSNCSLLAVTTHMMNGKFDNRVNVLLNCVAFAEILHAESVISKKLRSNLSRIGIPETKLSYLIADGASVMAIVAENLEMKYIHCCTHIINLNVSISLETSTACKSHSPCETSSHKLSKSAKPKCCYKRYLKEMSLPSVITRSDCPTRWSSTFTMFCNVLNVMSAFERLMKDLSNPAR